MDSLPLNRRQQKENPGFRCKTEMIYDAPVRGRTGALRGFKME